MKKTFTGILVALASLCTYAQVSDFENLELAPDSYWNGSDLSGGFHDGMVFFPNHYNPSYFSWTGFAFSNQTDITTSGWDNQYSVFAGSGYNGSSNFALAYGSDTILLDSAATIRGMYVTNGTYPALSMLHGDAYSKKFGGAQGIDPDWFKLIAKGIKPGGETTEELDFFLADYRFENSDSDYVLNTWEWFDLSPLGNIEKIAFRLESSDNGIYGMNTPAYFFIDHVNGIPASITQNSESIHFLVYPNPASDAIYFPVQNNSVVKIINSNGQLVATKNCSSGLSTVEISQLPKGIYFIRITEGKKIRNAKFIKE